MLSAKSDRFQSALTEKALRELNVLLLFKGYQVALFEDYVRTHDPAVLEDIITDLCLRIQCCTVHASRKAQGTMMLQKRIGW